MKTHVLLVEDDAGVAQVTKQMLCDNGYRVTVCGNAEEALVTIRESLPDVVVSDVGLPGLSGIKFLEILKGDERTMALPLILLTQLSSETDKIRGLRVGADDYLTKPFSHRELMARIEALLRRSKYAGAPVKRLQLGELAVDLDKREVTVRGKPVELRRKEYELLILLLKNKGKLIGREAITAALWKDEAIVTSNTLNVHVRNLRDKLGPYKDMIQTVIGEGFKLSDPSEGT